MFPCSGATAVAQYSPLEVITSCTTEFLCLSEKNRRSRGTVSIDSPFVSTSEYDNDEEPDSSGASSTCGSCSTMGIDAQ
ncbi:hypothetical protein BUALT_Bualt03G0121700 [Buddleja alternifolia]|uniref:Uncharacterized protein n=1 Tax=Buddleja alternifolia TaxID=168488 RepID=A0AAV6Y4C6_9LAMI|nr:hypothetical protein BUALT_Bualt03G0121700 [Buddleja alternifolia]